MIAKALKSKIESLGGSASKAGATAKMWIGLYETVVKYPGGDVSMVRPDGAVLAPFDAGKSIIAPWGISIDGNDNAWVANATATRSRNSAAHVPRTVRPAQRLATRFHRQAATSADCRSSRTT